MMWDKGVMLSNDKLTQRINITRLVYLVEQINIYNKYEMMFLTKYFKVNPLSESAPETRFKLLNYI